MKTITFFKVTLCFFFIVIVASACSKKDKDEPPQYNSNYYLSSYVKGVRKNSVILNYDLYYDYSPSLKLEFDRGIPEGSDWYLECNKSWVELTNTHGRVRSGDSEVISTNIGNNHNYEDREAHIYLNVPKGIPSSTYESTVTIHQYGYESHLNKGKSFSFTTNRSEAKSSKLSINNLDVQEIVEINWGDGNSDLITRMDKQKYTDGGVGCTISHSYQSNGSFKVKIRFAPSIASEVLRFRCQIGEGQGVEEVEYDSGRTVFHNNSLRVSISYYQEKGFDVQQKL